ncbi:MAG: class I SAM-dependent methyltransferase [Planctomycetota bacterium]
MTQLRCPACDEARHVALVTTPPLPVHCNAYAQSREAARSAPRAVIELVQCRNCAHVFNRAFDEASLTYDARYETSLHHSAVFVAWAEDLIARLESRFRERRLDVIEIGCGRGEFLAMLAARGHRCRGFDRSYDGRHAPSERLRIEGRDYDPSIDDAADVDLVVSRHVLEHLADPIQLLRSMRSAMTGHALGYLEVPNGNWTIRDGGIWDLIYEHAGYFVPTSLAALLDRANLAPLAIEEEFGRQFLAATIVSTSSAKGHRSTADRVAVARALSYGTRFSDTYRAELSRWSGVLEAEVAAGRKIALWGIGSKAVSFLNLLPHGSHIAYAIDQNPAKLGCFVPGSGHRITDPVSLRGVSLDTVLIANPRYLDEIRSRLGELGHADVRVLPLS